ncbi:glycosyltransferase family 2 protein [Enterococcus columbae]|uniref:Glycosyl transferase, group 2 family protein n=1 Tax=Enterococcus columbae DSM 7374 = ATCC 51263 TaxID=1121865 RepID=S0KC31_9ENTE|nr:glycosyltransferase family 2 protein [Enterococcus columbae]EOT42439.1 glycosyl transferase, group 2 family protein [Enterococcus columbae DSM 7374 = ATCC 51263]EOW87625.1 glycosyl transferase, group 2 family protein [Enterococcus columbae DSM 7374 = ATCC 51263]OJG22158.1 glycosyl transferase, group 2 family protein [Enterococcus columbae DSM 7374 = ATCC 51263]
MADKYTVYIDNILRNGSNGSIVINGWALDEESKTVPSIHVEGFPGNVQISYVYRGDVNALHKLASNVSAGFQIDLYGKATGPIQLVFEGQNCVCKKEVVIDGKLPLVPGTESAWVQKLNRFKRGLGYLRRNGLMSTLRRVKMDQAPGKSVQDYQLWIQQNENWDIEAIKAEISQFNYQPKISILMPVYNVDRVWLEKCIDSVKNQYYPNWELCMADDCSTDPNVRPILEKYAQSDERIKVVFRKENGHISKATNSALEIATGEFVALLDNDDELAPIAFYEVVKALNENPELDLIYSDEDKIDMQGNRFDPAFKPDWSYDLLLGTNYISHLGVYRRSIMNEIGGFRAGFEGSQDYDLVLRFTEKTTANRIHHIPKILYYWRILPTSTAADQSTKGYAFEAGLKAVQEALVRRNIKGTARHAAGNGLYDVEYEVLSEDLVSIIIPTRDGYDDMLRCLNSIVAKTTYRNYEIIVADNGSTDERMPKLYQKFKEQLGERFVVEVIDIPFNYSRINNLAAKKAKGKYLLFLNNDTEVITEGWITKMVSFAQFERIGVVGAKLYYPNQTIQHAGVVVGLGGAAGHCHHTYPKGDFGYFGKLEINVNYLAVTAACCMIRKADFDQLGGFEEELTVAFNDVDLCLREYTAGHDNVWLHGVELYHYESQTRGYENTPEKKKRFDEETQFMEARWGKYIENDPYYNPNLSRVGGHFGIRLADEK